jgi:hypothetical protein
MEAGQPDDDIAQDRVDISDRLAKTRHRRQHRSDIADVENRERMVFQPGSRDRRQRYGQQQSIQGQMRRAGGELHPGRHGRRFRGRLEEAPQDPQQDEPEQQNADCFMRLPRGIERGRIDALLAPAWAHEVGRSDQSGGEPMEQLRDGAIAKARAAHRHLRDRHVW